jgi:hypothetical protein
MDTNIIENNKPQIQIMNWKDELKEVAASNTAKPDTNLDIVAGYKSTYEAKKFINAVIEKLNVAKSILESDFTEVDIEKSNPEKDRYTCSISIKSSKHSNFKYTIVSEVKNENIFVISKQYIDGWVINGPIEVKKVNITNHWNENAIKILVNTAMDDLTNTYKLVCEYIQ